MKSYFSKFILLSFVLTSALGFFQGDSQSLQSQEPVYGIEMELNAEDFVNNGLTTNGERPTAEDRPSDDNFTFKFPNIFDVFRSLF